MARFVKEQEHLLRRSEILQAAQRLIYTKGYEEMTIQDVLDDAHISKGAFYHYFDSKADLLQALSEQIMDQAETVLNPIITNPELSAIEKFNQYLATGAMWKASQKHYLMAMLRGWYSDENAIIRQKVTAAGLSRIAPLLDIIIAQGIEEGSFQIAYPDAVSKVILTLLQGFSETLAGLILQHKPEVDNLDKMKRTVAANNEAVERVLGASPGQLDLVDPNVLHEWASWTVESYQVENTASLPQREGETV